MSSDYFVPWEELVASEDATSSDQHRIGDKYNARWCYWSREAAWKPMRLDYNPRTPANDDWHKVVTPAIAWANGSQFWFGGDAATMDIPRLLDEGELVSSVFAKYAVFYRIYKRYLAVTGADLVYHSEDLGLPTGLTGGLRATGAGSRLYRTMWSMPGDVGVQYHVIHLVNVESPGIPSQVELKVDVPPYERVTTVRLLSPDATPDEQVLATGQVVPDTVGHWETSRGLLVGGGEGYITTVSLPPVIAYSVVVIEYETERTRD